MPRATRKSSGARAIVGLIIHGLWRNAPFFPLTPLKAAVELTELFSVFGGRWQGSAQAGSRTAGQDST